MTAEPSVVGLYDKVATVYARTRPGYPRDLVQDVMQYGELSAGMKVLEVGAGTGLATRAFVRHGLRLHCIEPSNAMAAILAAEFAEVPDVTVEVADFFDSCLTRGGYDAVIAGQSWHYLDPATRLEKSAHVLGGRGILATFWNSPPGPTGSLAERFRNVYQVYAPDLLSPGEHGVAVRPKRRFAADTNLFDGVTMKKYQGVRVYGADEFISLLGTYNEYDALPPQRRSALYAALHRLIEETPKGVEMSYDTILHLARVRAQ